MGVVTMLRKLVLVLGAVAVGGLSGVAYSSFNRSLRPADMVEVVSGHPMAEADIRTVEPSTQAVNKVEQPSGEAVLLREGTATETSTGARIDPPKQAVKTRSTPRLILGIGW